MYGVNRSSMDYRYGGYATGNCAHCHEMHASLEGTEPAPAGGAAPHALFSQGFNTGRTRSPYPETDNFCFHCHSENAGQRVMNQDYSAAFGGAAAGTGPQSILAAFNQESYHNLYDIWVFLRSGNTYPWFGDHSNPCSACHNSHLAKRNWNRSKPGFPLLSAISKPGDRSRLWGETELMSAYASYEAPYAADASLGAGREPAGQGDPDGGNSPDYVGFCTSCHNRDNAIVSTPLGRELKRIDWGTVGPQNDKHGGAARGGTVHLREPYGGSALFKGNFVLSCLDCHEPHGSENVMLLRRRINGGDLGATVASTDVLGHSCRRCHLDDLGAGAGTGQANSWEYVHHLAPDAPYAKQSCASCHGPGSGGASYENPVPCGSCHGHGMVDSGAGTNMTGRKTF